MISVFIKIDTQLPPFVALPRFILNSGLSLNAKLLYGLLLSRTLISQKNKWTDQRGHVYIIYTIREMAEDLDRSERTVKNALNDLDEAGLLLRVRQGWNQPNRLYVQMPDMVQVSSPLKGNSVPDEVQDSSHCMGQTLPPKYTDKQNKRKRRMERDSRSLLGTYHNVELSSEELEALRKDFPGRTEAYVEKLSVYMKQHGKDYADHAATIRKWLSEDQSSGAAYDYDHVYEEGECL